MVIGGTGRRIAGWLVGMALSTTGCGGSDLQKPNGVGQGCVPGDEYSPSFSGYSVAETTLDFGSAQCLTGVCLVNHFQGRVSCPYGQTMEDVDAARAGGTPACVIPGKSGASAEDQVFTPVMPQLLSRRPDSAVYCSCRCANAQGNTSDGAAYCACPRGYECAQLVPNLGLINQAMTGGFCMKSGTAYNPAGPQQECNPLSLNCGPVGPQLARDE